MHPADAAIEAFELGEGHALLSGWLAAPIDGALLLRLGEDGAGFALRPQPPRADGRPGFWALGALPLDWRDGPAMLLGAGEPRMLALPPPVPLSPRGGFTALRRSGLSGWVLDLPGRAAALVLEDRLHLPLAPFLQDGAFHIPLDMLARQLRGQDPALSLLDGTGRGIALLSGGQEVAHMLLRWPGSVEGRLDQLRPGLALGWVRDAEQPGSARVETLLDGTRWQDVPARPAEPGAEGRQAFRATLPHANPADAPAPLVTLRAGRPLPGALRLEGLAPWRPDLGAVIDHLPHAGFPPVAIIVPIHNAAEDLARCIDSVLAHTTGPARLILIDDASTDPAIADILARHEGQPGIAVHRNPRNLGFTATANRGLALAGRDDVVLLNSDAIVGPGWLTGLRIAAHGRPGIGTVTPISNNAGAFSAPEIGQENTAPPWLAPADLVRLARQAALGLWPEVPTGNGFCLYVRRACLDAVGTLDEAAFPRGYGEENDLCLRAGRAGFVHLVDDRTLVWHRRSASFGETRHPHMIAGRAVLDARYPDYTAQIRVFQDDPGFLALRWRLRRALETMAAVGASPRPRVLFVISTATGGTPQTNQDLMAALADRCEPWLLRVEGTKVELSRHRPDAEAEMVESFHLLRGIHPATHTSHAYDRAIATLLLRHAIELVHVRHLAWHGFGLTTVCRRLGIPVVLSFHDFYMACPTVKLLDGDGRFCGGTCTTGEADCVAELWPAEAMPPLRDRFVHRWRALAAPAIAACDAFVTTSDSARQTLLGVFPPLAEADFRVIPHGRNFAAMASLAAPILPGEALRVLVPGNISRAKGAALIAEVAALDQGRSVVFHMLGQVDSALRTERPGVVLHGPYARADFAARVASIAPHLAAVLSLWPETWCHTLTECWAAGLPVLATALGAPADRMADSGAGWLVPPDVTPETLLDLLRGLPGTDADVAAKLAAVAAWQQGEGRYNTTAAMAAQYAALYRDVLARQRSFVPPALPSAPAADGPSPAAWTAAHRPAAGACRILLLDTPPPALADALRPLARCVPPGGDPTACHLALATAPGAPAEATWAAMAAGLPVLRPGISAAEQPGPTEAGHVVLPQASSGWLRAIAALVADAPGRALLGRRARRAAMAAITPGGQKAL